MTPRQLLSPQARAALFDPPMEVRAIVRHYTFSIEDVALIRQRRRNANRLGFAVHLAYLRFPGRVLGPNETPPAHLLAFIADQLRINPKSFEDYAQRDETRTALAWLREWPEAPLQKNLAGIVERLQLLRALLPFPLRCNVRVQTKIPSSLH